MEIIVGKTAGFCFGVKNAIDKTKEEIEKNKNIYCLGELVHNKQVTEELIKKGVTFIDKIDDAKNKVIIRAHGAPKSVYEMANKLNIEIKDLTCPKVLHIHDIAEKYKNKNYFIFLVGQKKHPEIVGTISFCGDNATIIESQEDVKEAIERFNKLKLENALVIAQTTFSLEKFNSITNKLQENIKNLEIKNTICNATKKRQEETLEMSKKVDLMIIIGGKHSSNSNKLYEVASKNCNNVLFIETKDEIEIEKIKSVNRIGIMAGASTPEKSIIEVVDILKKIC